MISRTGAAVLMCIVLASAVSSPTGAGGDDEWLEQYLAEIRDWRERRHQRLRSDDGWMTLVGLEWLLEGDNRIGSAPSSDVRIPGGPADWGTIRLTGDRIVFHPAPNSDITVDGEVVERAELTADSQGRPNVVRSGDLSFYVIYRQSYALRIKDRKAPTLLAYERMPVYDIDPSWRVEGRFERAAPGATVEVADVLGHTNQSPVYGTFEFERNGETFRLTGLGAEDATSIEFMFADRTSGRETYGAGRFVYSEGVPENGRLVVDFNKAYNPPCAFTEYSTCPLPLPGNRLDLWVRAGEKKYHD